MVLLDAMGVGRGDWVALIGGGGKTTLLHQLGREARAAGISCLLTTTTRMLPSPEVMAGPVDSAGKLTALRPGQIELARRRGGFELVVVEADGSRGLPLKAHAAHEPVVPEQTTCLVAVAGLLALGRSLQEGQVHRPELLARRLGIPPGASVGPEVFVLAVREYLRLPVPGRRIVVLNQARNPALCRAGREIAAELAGARTMVLVRGEAVPSGVEVFR
ncbi:MAG: putative selenium-dependent hydroxylase accessory protein YqeC [Armatimonadetes bacterium]|nr:putative selenium-dependent hydroxylase accessory protein YqeC [Armatimonadota bacterium]